MEGDDGRHSQRHKVSTTVNSSGRGRKIIALTGTAAIIAIAANFAFLAFKSRKNRRNRKELVGSNVRVNISAFEIRKLADQIVAESKGVHDALASVPVDKVKYQDIMALAELEARQFPMIQSCIFPRLVSMSDDVRKASAEAERLLNTHFASCRKREDVYRVVKAFVTRGEWINAEAKSYVQVLFDVWGSISDQGVVTHITGGNFAQSSITINGWLRDFLWAEASQIRDFERNGLNLTSTKKEEVQHLQARIDDLSMQYIQNLNDDGSFLLFTKTELEGLPAEFLQILDRAADDKIKVPLKSNYVSPIVELCKIGATRRRVAVAYGQRCKEVNVPLLENLVVLRHKLAKLLGYDNYAEYAVCSRMAKTTSKVFEFLEDLSTSLSDLAAKEFAILQDLKKKEEGDCPFGIEDLLYYVKKFEDEKFNLDFATLKQYFPLSFVLQGIFKVLQDLFGLRFEEILGASVWDEDVRVFSVFDLSSGELIGYAYLDLYSRVGKYGQTCVLPLQNGSLSSNGARQVPVVLMISGFTKEDGNCPVLLRFSEVVNLFHEFGHVAHHLCNHASLVRFSGLRVDPDFVEIPGHMFENWCYDSSILKLISGYYQDITRPIKNDVCISLRSWRHSFSALKLRQEILYCLFDQIIHSTDNVDFLELFKYLHPKMMLEMPVLEGTNPASCFPHSAIGYEATCYSRIWSKVFAADMFASKFCDGLLNHHIGMQFRNKVLAPGGARDPLECLSNFMGRQPSIQAFVDSIALSEV